MMGINSYRGGGDTASLIVQLWLEKNMLVGKLQYRYIFYSKLYRYITYHIVWVLNTMVFNISIIYGINNNAFHSIIYQRESRVYVPI